jgi:tetratricopeptide (TPR) repeat protein
VSANTTSLYNPDWLSDDDLVAGFVARLELFGFLRDELRRAPVRGTVQHYLLVGVRGSGKTTLLKRLAVAVRREPDLRDHLVAVSFPEELYQVKHLADLWWAACEALADALDQEGLREEADALSHAVEARSLPASDEHDDAGLRCLMEASARLGRRPVLFVDNLDLVLRRIDKKGKKRKDPDSAAYWALREALSTSESPIVIGGSVRLSEPFTDSDKPFYDFFLPKRLATLSLPEVQKVLGRLAEGTGDREIVARIEQGAGRIRALHDLTGGNPRALGLVFELIRQGPSGRAVHDFERLLDLTTPYYKARFEELPEQAQAVLHALATITRDEAGLATAEGTAAVVAKRVGLQTKLVSAQLEHLVNEGVVQKHSPDKGRNRYQVAEQLFRLWIQMRTNRRLRLKVVGLAEYLEALWDREELESAARAEADGQASRGGATLAMALAVTAQDDGFRRSQEGRAVDTVLRLGEGGAGFEAAFEAGDLQPEVYEHGAFRVRCRELAAALGGTIPDAADLCRGLIVGLCWGPARLERLLAGLADPAKATEAAAEIRAGLAAERRNLERAGVEDADVEWLYRLREQGSLRRSGLTPADAEADRDTCGLATWRSFLWRLLAGQCLPLRDRPAARQWLAWGREHFADAPAERWAAVAQALRRAEHLELAEEATELAFSRGESARGWYERAALLGDLHRDRAGSEAAYRRAIELVPSFAWPWYALGTLLAQDPARLAEAEAAHRRSIDLDPSFAWPWNNLGILLAWDPARLAEAEAAFRRSIELDETYALPWSNLGVLLSRDPARLTDSVAALDRAVELDPDNQRARILLSGLRLQAESHRLRAALVDGDWQEVDSRLREALDAPDEGRALLAAPEFAREVVGLAVLQERGRQLLDLLRELGADRSAGPLLLALDVALGDATAKLRSAPAEMRAAALHLYGLILEADSEAGSPGS